MTSRLAFAACVLVVVAPLTLSGCRTSAPAAAKERPEDQLFAARQEYRQTIDGLYRTYGGSDVPGNSPPTTGSPGAPPQDEGVVGHVVSEADRSYFERQCLAVGRGERPFNVSGKMQRFLDTAENARGCRNAAMLQERIAQLEKRVANP
ncbi:MAG TPA: hypothetical protein VFK85_12650 [Anaeromyxobacteraceae bacterium]|nr:hypothetical protein [Anaeromyxobacteraceae bacterium]